MWRRGKKRENPLPHPALPWPPRPLSYTIQVAEWGPWRCRHRPLLHSATQSPGASVRGRCPRADSDAGDGRATSDSGAHTSRPRTSIHVATGMIHDAIIADEPRALPFPFLLPGGLRQKRRFLRRESWGLPSTFSLRCIRQFHPASRQEPSFEDRYFVITGPIHPCCCCGCITEYIHTSSHSGRRARPLIPIDFDSTLFSCTSTQRTAATTTSGLQGATEQIKAGLEDGDT